MRPKGTLDFVPKASQSRERLSSSGEKSGLKIGRNKAIQGEESDSVGRHLNQDLGDP